MGGVRGGGERGNCIGHSVRIGVCVCSLGCEKLVWNALARVDAHARGRGGARATRREVRRRRRGRTRRGRRRGGCGCGWMDGFVFVRSRAVMRRMDARARECVNARASAMDDRRRARAFAFDRRRWCAREDDEGETRRRTGEEYIYIYIFARSRVARARARRVAGSKRREIDDEDDGC